MCALLQPRTSTTHPTKLLCAWFLQDNNCTNLEKPLFLHWPLQNHNPPKNEYLNLNLKRLSHQNVNIQYVCHVSCWDIVSMKMFVHVVSLLQCDKNTSILLVATQKKKQTNLQSLPGRTLAGLSQSLTKPSLKFEIINLLFLHPMATLFYSDNCRDSSSTKGIAAGTPASFSNTKSPHPRCTINRSWLFAPSCTYKWSYILLVFNFPQFPISQVWGREQQ